MPDTALPTNLTDTFWETYVRPQVVVTCLSTARPAGIEGRHIWEVDKQRLMVYRSGAWRYASPQRGRVTLSISSGYGEATVNFPNVFTSTPRVSVTVAGNAGAHQYYLATCTQPSTSSVIIRCRHISGTPSGDSIGIDWIAVEAG